MGKTKQEKGKENKSYSSSSETTKQKKSNTDLRKKYKIIFYNYKSEYESEELRKKIRALLKSFYGYTDDNNPFGDPELSRPFFWSKKIIKMRSLGLEPIVDSQTLLVRLKEAKKEINNIVRSKKNREELKDAIQAERHKNGNDQRREDEWKEKDEKFHLAQENLRTEIRISQGREKPIDFINKVLMIWKGFAEPPRDFNEIPEYQRPYRLFEIIDSDSLSELYNQLKLRLQIDKERMINKSFVCFYIDIVSNFKKQHNISEEDLIDFIKYWEAMIAIIESYIFPERNIKNLSQEQLEQINSILAGKTSAELDELEELMKTNQEEQISVADIQFWNNALSVLQINKCKGILDDFYKEFLTNFESYMTKENEKMVTIAGSHPSNLYEIHKKWNEEGNLSPPMYESDEELRKAALSEHDYLIKLSETRKILLAHQLTKWQKNLEESIKVKETEPVKYIKNVTEIQKYFPYDDEVASNTFINNQTNDIEDSDEEVEKYLNKINKKEKIKQPNIPANNTNMIASSFQNSSSESYGPLVKASRFYLKDETTYDFNLAREMVQIESQELGEGETIFNDVVQLNNSSYMWASKYKPRKPRYFNRVKTGYEWNKYNQVHYDYENPPPKVIQGYKFNIFYPDLIDKTKAPQYSLERSDTADTCIIKFHAGPPYEDIAFKIVNREWDMNERAGFRNLFDRGILHLYFNFKRYRYKR